MCDLCDAVNSNRYKRYSCFIYIPKCATCGIPMLVLRRHKAQLDDHEKVQFEMVMKEFFQDYRARGIGMRSNSLHWHEHLLKEGD